MIKIDIPLNKRGKQNFKISTVTFLLNFKTKYPVLYIFNRLKNPTVKFAKKIPSARPSQPRDTLITKNNDNVRFNIVKPTCQNPYFKT